MENLTGYDNIVCEFALCTLNILDRVVNEFDVVYVQREKSQHLLYCNNISSKYFQEQK